MESLNSTLPSTFNIPVAYLKNYSQQLMKIWGDKTSDLNPNDLLRFKLPNTVIDLKTLNSFLNLLLLYGYILFCLKQLYRILNRKLLLSRLSLCIFVFY